LIPKEAESHRGRVGSLRLTTYKRIGRVCSVETLRKILEESKHAGKSEDKNQEFKRIKDKQSD
jgi:hypothetical protein